MLQQFKQRYIRFLDQRQDRKTFKRLEEQRRELFISSLITFNSRNISGLRNRTLSYKKVRTTADHTHHFQ